MPRGGYRPGAGRPKGSASGSRAPAKPKAERKPAPVTIHDEGAAMPAAADMEQVERSPLEYMLAVMNDITADGTRRDRMAVAAAPFVHMKKGEGGKKDERGEAAKAAATGRLTPAAPPKFVLVK